MPGIVVVLGAADVRSTFVWELRERGRDVTSPCADLPEPPAVAGELLVIEDAARLDVATLEAICRAPGLRVVLAGLPTFALPELLVPLTVVTLEPPSPGPAAAPGSSRSNAQMAIASVVLGATWMTAGLLWTHATLAPPAPARSGSAALQPAVEMPLPPGSSLDPAEPAPTVAAIATPPPAPAASEQSGDATSAASPAPMPAGDKGRTGIGAWLEFSPVPVVAPTGPRSGSEPAPPALQAGPSPAAAIREAFELPPAAAVVTKPSGPAAPSGNSPQRLPDNAPIRVLVSYAPRSATARQEAAELVRRLRGGGLEASGPAPAARVAGKAGITYFFAEDRDGTRRVEHDLGEGFGPSRLSPTAPGVPLPRPGTIEVLVPARRPP
jgi:hypothetical protein